MRRFFACITYLLFACDLYGQNMVVNPDFELSAQCPTFMAQFNAPYILNWSTPTLGTSDYYNSCFTTSSTGPGVPYNSFGYQPAFSGNGYGGGYFYTPGLSSREYMRGTLTPLVPNTVYKVTIRASLSNRCQYATANFHVLFYQNGTNSVTSYYLPATPQIDYSFLGIVTDTMGWVTLVDTFTADSAYSNFIIGNFSANSNTISTLAYPGGNVGGAYYYIDSVSVVNYVYTPPQLSVSSTATCFGGSTGTASVTASGGLPPYTYLWQPGNMTTSSITGLTAGVYTVAVTDATNTTVTQTITITQPPSAPVLAVTNTTPATCGQQNGSISVSVTGGQPSYSYYWWPTNGTGPTAFNLAGGTYTCIVIDADGCSDTVSVSLSQTNAFTLTASSTNVDCFNAATGSATVTPTGGTAPFSYYWSNGQTTQNATNLTAGTYTVTVTDANGCTGTATINITQPPQLTALITSSIDLNCFGQNTGSATVSVSGGTPGYTYLWNNGQTSATASALTAGTYTVTVTDSKGCTAAATVSIVQPPQLNLNVTSVSITSCGQNNGSASVSASGGTPGYTYSWSPYGGTSSTANNLGAGVFVVTVTDTKGCTDTVHITISTSTPLSVSVGSFSNVSCYGQNTGSASVNVSGGTGPYTYNWSNGGTTSSISNVPAGSYGVTVTDQNGCAGTALISIAQPPQLNAIISSSININCFGQNTGSAFTAVSGGTPGYTYLWSNGSTASSIFGATTGTYSVVVTDANGCHDTAQTTITQPPALNVSINTANATCSQNNGWANANVTGGTSPYTYNWSNGQTTQSSSSLGAGSYTVNVTDANGCTGSATVAITQSASLTLNVAPTHISCNGISNGSASVSVSTGTPPYTYNWSNGGTTATVNNLSAGTYTITVTDAINCQGTTTVTITEPVVLTASILASSDALCNGTSSGSAEATASGGTAPYTYLWSNNGTTALQSTLPAGTYFVVVTDTNGCADSATVTIAEPPAITLSAQATVASCVGEAQGAASVTASGGIPPYSYAWNSNPVQTTSSATNLPAGNYIASVTDSNGCVVSTSVTILAHPQPSVDAGDDVTYCYGKDQLTLHAMGALSYLWSPPMGLSCTACPDPVADPTATTTYTVVGTDNNGCTGSDNILVTVITKELTSVGEDKDICSGESTQLFATGGIQYSWSPAENMNDNALFNPTVTPTQTTTYTVTVRQNDCFTDTLSQTVTVHSMPTISLGPDIKSASGASIDLIADTTNATTITWSPAFNLSCDDCTDPVAFIEKDIRYVATVTNGGCIAMDDISIRISCSESDVFVPNSFTPNADGNNDMFYPQSGVSLAISYMAVYDRWGEKIFEKENFRANDPSAGWDGTYKGRSLEPNIYVYYIQFLCGNGQKLMMKGDIAIVK
jgi:gliding motility-associated-like protein